MGWDHRIQGKLHCPAGSFGCRFYTELVLHCYTEDMKLLAEKELLQEGHSRSSGLELTPWFCSMPLQ